MDTLRVELGSRSYPIHIGKGLLASPELILPHLRRRAMVVSNETVAPLWLDRLRAMVDGIALDSVILPDGERYKTLATMDQIYTALLEGRHDRGTTLIALGGGVVGDMAGFAAATYQRGVDFIQVPTTLLAQVDSSVGGKTGVNHPLGKNMIGAFHQPQCVVVDTGTLSTLPDRELSAGLAEVIKYGIIADAEFFSWLEENIDALLARDDGALVHAIRRSCEIKARIVAEDEREAGVRALLNLGHTFGHAIEAGMGYGEWLHGEAVAAGMVMAARMAARLGWLVAGEVDRIVALTARARLPVAPPPEVGADRFLELMAVDKKAQEGRVRLVLPRGIGAAVVTADYPDGVLRAVLDGRSAA